MSALPLRHSVTSRVVSSSKPVTTPAVDLQTCLLLAMEDTQPRTKLITVATVWGVKEPYAHRMLHGEDPMNAERLEAIAEQLPELFDAFITRVREARGHGRQRLARLLAALVEEVADLPAQRPMLKAELS